MKKTTLIFTILSFAFTSYLQGQKPKYKGPNATFNMFVEMDSEPEFICNDDNCATIFIAYEKGTFINKVKLAIGIGKYVVAVEKQTYIELKIVPEIYKITLPQGINQGKTRHVVANCDGDNENFISLCSQFSNAKNYTIKVGKDAKALKTNITPDPYAHPMQSASINVLKYERDFKPGEKYYFKALYTNGISYSCGPLITETSAEDFNKVINGDNIKEISGPIYYVVSITE